MLLKWLLCAFGCGQTVFGMVDTYSSTDAISVRMESWSVAYRSFIYNTFITRDVYASKQINNRNYGLVTTQTDEMDGYNGDVELKSNFY